MRDRLGPALLGRADSEGRLDSSGVSGQQPWGQGVTGGLVTTKKKNKKYKNTKKNNEKKKKRLKKNK